jgi:peptidyl-dipeptidase A
MLNSILRLTILLSTLSLLACENSEISVTISDEANEVTAESAVEFVARSEEQLAGLAQEAERMAWVYSNFITDDTEQLAATANKKLTARQVELAVEAAEFKAGL